MKQSWCSRAGCATVLFRLKTAAPSLGMRRLYAGLMLGALFCLHDITRAQISSAASKAAPRQEALADFTKTGGFRDQLLTKCGDLYYFGPVDFSGSRQEERYGVLEFSDVTRFDPVQLNPNSLAAQKNQSWSWEVRMYFSTMRARHELNGAWEGPWGPYQDNKWNADNTGSYAVIATGQNVNHVWSWDIGKDLTLLPFAHSFMQTFLGLAAPTAQPLETREELKWTRAAQISCAALQGDLSQSQIDAKVERERKARAIDAAHRRFLEDVDRESAQGPAALPRSATDGFRLLYSVPLQERHYVGTVEGFARELPGYFKQAFEASGLSDLDSGREIAYIIGALRTCEQIAPEMARRSALPQYSICNKDAPIPPSVTGAGPATKRGIHLSILPTPPIWREGQGFIARVMFTPLQDDGADLKNRGLILNQVLAYTIVYATVVPIR